ncbi:hypothetical protein SBBP1_430035 [Burkholderiales bacterium]|nr:hypothetical protein SBBP1_430035 [Burkholderiales bacterium]
MTEVSDSITLGELVSRSAKALAHAGLEHRIDIYRDVDVDDPAVSRMLGQRHTVRVRIKITATSLLFDAQEKADSAINAPRFREGQT